MRAGIAVLVLAYVLSQFYRAFLAVLAPALEADLGVGPEALSRASGLWFLVFAAAQFPVGWALDTIGPRRLTAGLLGLGAGGGALLFALAAAPWHIDAAMVLIGLGCSSVLMASFFIFARCYPARVFATMAGATIGIGSLGNLAGSLPLALAVEAFGWRATMAGLSAITLAMAVAIAAVVRDPPRAERGSAQGGSVLDLLKMPVLWAILPLALVNYAPAAGLRGLWIGPFFADLYGADAAGIGTFTLVMGLAMIAGNFAYGPLDRLLGTRKWVILGGNLAGALACLALAAAPLSGAWTAAALFAAIGFFGASFPVIVAHARAFVPAHLTGRGVTLVNFFGIGGVGLMQLLSGKVFAAAGGAPHVGAYVAILVFFGVAQLVGLAIYAFSRDSLE